MLARIITLSLVLLCGTARADDFTRSRAIYLNRIAERHQSPDFSIVTARITTHTHLDEAYAQLDSLLLNPSGDMFYMYSSMACLLYLHDTFSPALRARFHDVWKTYTFYRGDTENHFLMYYTGLFLAAQEWPDLPGTEWFNGKSSEENAKESADYLFHWSDNVARYGFVEFDSPRYLYYFATPLIVLREFSRDSTLRTRAELMLHLLFADAAADYLHGSYCGAHSRDGESNSIAPRTAEGMSYAGLYFGDVDVPKPLQDVAYGALSSYRLPEIIRDLAINKPSAVVHREQPRGREHIRFDSIRSPTVQKTTFVTPDVSLGSLSGGIAQPIQQRSWSLVFRSDKRENRIFALHPTNSARELGTFFPEELGLLVDDIGKAKAGYASENKWIGGSASEQIRQDKNVLVALYDIPADDPVDHIDYFVPNDLDSVQRDASGWIFFAEGDAFGAVLPLRPIQWIVEGDHVRMRSVSRRNGYVVVVGSRTYRPQIRDFAAFKNDVRRAKIDTSAFASRCEISVAIGNRAPFHCSYAQPQRMDSSLFVDAEFPYLRSHQSGAPHIYSVRGSGDIEISRPGEMLELDFSANTIRHTFEKEVKIHN